MNMKKYMTIFLTSILLASSISSASAMENASPDAASDAYPLIAEFGIQEEETLELSCSASREALCHLHHFLFKDKPWSSIPKQIRTSLIYTMGIHNRRVNIRIMELPSVDSPDESFKYDTIPPIVFRGIRAILLKRRILENM